MKKLAIVFCLGAQFFIYGNTDAQTHLKIIQQNGKFGLKERGEKGKIVLPPEYSRMDKFNNGVAIVAKDGALGMIDTMGRIVVPVRFTAINEFHSGVALVKDKNGKFGFMNPKGEMVFEPVFDKAEEFYDKKKSKDIETAIVSKDGKSGMISPNGKYIIEPAYDKIGEYSDGLAAVTKDGKTGFIDRSGRVVIEPTFTNVEDFVQGKAKYSNDGILWGFINKTGEPVIEAQYEELGEYNEGMVAFKQKGKWGFLNAEGEVVAKPVYTKVEPFSEGLAVVYFAPKQYRGKYTSTDRFLKAITKDNLEKEGYGYIDKYGEVLFMPYFSEANSFKNGIAIVKLKDGKPGYIDRRGNFTQIKKKR